jgi:hypothetical protein
MAKGEKIVSFESVLVHSANSFNWYYIPVDAKYAEDFGFKGNSRRVVCTLNNAETFQCALMPMDGAFFIIVNKKVRTRLGIEAGHSVNVELIKDSSKYGLPMPEEFEEVLAQDDEGRKYFDDLTEGKKRTLIYSVSTVKDIDRRIHRAIIFLEHLKRHGGKIISKELAEEIKRPLL